MSLLQEVWARPHRARDQLGLRVVPRHPAQTPTAKIRCSSRTSRSTAGETRARSSSACRSRCSRSSSPQHRAATTATRGSRAEQEREPHDRRVLAAQHARQRVAARLPEFRMSMRDIAAMTDGSMLSTGVPRDSPIRSPRRPASAFTRHRRPRGPQARGARDSTASRPAPDTASLRAQS